MSNIYNNFIEDVLENFEFGDPIFLRRLIGKLQDNFGVNKKYAEYILYKYIKNDTSLKRCSNATFYKSRVIPTFGETRITTKKLILEKYIKGNMGYETGYTLFHKVGLTSLMPARLTIVSNRVKTHIYDIKLNVFVYPPRIPITEDNRYYLQFLDMLDLYNKSLIDAYEPYVVIIHFLGARQLSLRKLRKIAKKHYNRYVVEQVELFHERLVKRRKKEIASGKFLYTIDGKRFLSSGADMIATHMNVPYGDVVKPEDVIATLRSGEFRATTKNASEHLVSMFVEVEPELILRCAREVQAPLANLKRLYRRSVELGYYQSREWEQKMAALEDL